jgi:predicted transposase/invertase (TIGR01784 family)
MSNATHHPHDKLFKTVFSNVDEAVSFMQLHLPTTVQNLINWSTLRVVEGSFIDEEFTERESDILYQVALFGYKQPALLYLLFEHQSRPDRWMPRRLLRYVDRVWDESFKLFPEQPDLPPVVPLVFYQGEQSWNYSTELADLLPDFARNWSFIPRFSHILIDQSGLNPQMVEGGVRARVMQLLMFAAYHEPIQEALILAASLLAKMPEASDMNYVRLFVRYLLATQAQETVAEFVETVEQFAAERGEKIMTYAEELLREGEQRGKLKGELHGELRGELRGELKGQIEIIEKLLQAGVHWATIEQATGVDAQKFAELKQELARLWASSLLGPPARSQADLN